MNRGECATERKHVFLRRLPRLMFKLRTCGQWSVGFAMYSVLPYGNGEEDTRCASVTFPPQSSCRARAPSSRKLCLGWCLAISSQDAGSLFQTWTDQGVSRRVSSIAAKCVPCQMLEQTPPTNWFQRARKRVRYLRTTGHPRPKSGQPQDEYHGQKRPRHVCVGVSYSGAASVPIQSITSIWATRFLTLFVVARFVAVRAPPEPEVLLKRGMCDP